MILKLLSRIFGRRPAPATAATTEPGVTHGAKPEDGGTSATPAARRAARASRGKGTGRDAGPVMVPPATHGIDAKLLSANATRVTRTLQEAGFKAFVVGGAVRDLLLHVKPKDFDVATNATPEEIQRLFRRAHIIGRRFRLVHVMFGADTIEVSTFRANAPMPATDGTPPPEPVVEVVPEGRGRKNSGAGQRVADEHGRVLRDNIFGSQEEDAARRDFTVNALFYDPATQTVIDYHHGVADVKARTLRMIGDPEKRYREDPVRMLRAVRFAAKLDFTIDEATREPIARLAPLLENVPAARLFDEMLKLMLSGHALACLKRLRAEGLHHGMLPLLDVVFEQPLGERFVTLALQNTDDRVRVGKPTTPSFLFAALMWHEVLKEWNDGKARGEPPIQALGDAMDRVLEAQTEKLAIQRRYTSDMREIWGLQPRLERRTGRAPWRLLEHPRFRAGYDFLLLRAAAGEIDESLAEWWTRFIDADAEGREALQGDPGVTDSGAGPAKRKRKRKKKASIDGAAASIDRAGDGDRAEPAREFDHRFDRVDDDATDDAAARGTDEAPGTTDDDATFAEPAAMTPPRRAPRPAADAGTSVAGASPSPVTAPEPTAAAAAAAPPTTSATVPADASDAAASPAGTDDAPAVRKPRRRRAPKPADDGSTESPAADFDPTRE